MREAMWWVRVRVRVRGVRVSEDMGESWGCSVFGWEGYWAEIDLNGWTATWDCELKVWAVWLNLESQRLEILLNNRFMCLNLESQRLEI